MPDAATPTASYCATRRCGAATITVINDGNVTLPVAEIFAAEEAAWLREAGEADSQGNLLTAQLIVHIALGDRSIVIDPAFDDPGTAWDRRFATRWTRVRRTPGLAAALAALGIAPTGVTDVIFTHAHDDHFVGALYEADGELRPRFPNARHLLGRADWDGNPRRDQPDSEVARRLGALDARGLLVPVAGEYEVTPGVTILSAPGESPGHQIVRVQSEGERFYALGDLFHHASEFAHLDWFSPWNDPAAIRDSRARFLAEAVPSGAVAVFTHALFPGWGRAVRAGAGYRWEARIAQ
jgi:glyoxylase-like metal-dependent hydrolase (beta-lactamase superfamily II)